MTMGQMTVDEYDQLRPSVAVKYQGHKIRFSTPNMVTFLRAQHLLDKEPITIEWILGFTPGDVLIDVGANVGTYSMFAAVMRDAKVYAFEPEAQNFALLNRNIA